MLFREIVENSPDTPSGSKTYDLNLGKFWLLTSLKKLGLDQFDNVYVLGSWYGSFGPYLQYKKIKFNHAYLIDIDPKKTQWTTQFNRSKNIDSNITAVTQDCNDTKFFGDQILVINTSTNDISNRSWLDNTPLGSIVAVQGRDEQPDNKNNLYQTLDSFNLAYPLNQTFLLDSIVLKGADGKKYNRFMKIGRR